MRVPASDLRRQLFVLARVVLNLGDNAIKFTTDGGSVVLATVLLPRAAGEMVVPAEQS